jgi:hypothetical protein
MTSVIFATPGLWRSAPLDGADPKESANRSG